MASRHTAPILVLYAIYLVALAVTTALLVFWVLVVQRFETGINQFVSRHLVEGNYFHWFVHTFGVGLFFLLILALTYLLAVTLSERRSARKQDEFLANMTHELKSPVAAIKLHAQTLEQSDDLGSLERRSLGYILQQAERVGSLVDNLLEGSRQLASRHKPALQPINLRQFFSDYQREIEGRFDLREIDLRFEVRTQAVVMASQDALLRIMDNLIDNAVRFTNQGGEIFCEVSDHVGRAEIVVADTGVGIPKRDLGRIFDRFYRFGREVQGKRRGTGLGLAIVRGLVEELRGRIRAVSRDDGPGTRFEIELPVSSNGERQA